MNCEAGPRPQHQTSIPKPQRKSSGTTTAQLEKLLPIDQLPGGNGSGMPSIARTRPGLRRAGGNRAPNVTRESAGRSRPRMPRERAQRNMENYHEPDRLAQRVGGGLPAT